MARQRIPDAEKMKEYNELCSIAFSRRTGARVDVELNPLSTDEFQIPQHVTKSYVFGAHVNVKNSEASVPIPSKVIVKQYIPGVIRTSEDKDTTKHEFKIERAILDLDINAGSNGGKVRIYPEFYSGDAPECDEKMVIIREFIPGENLEQIAERQISSGGIKWEGVIGTPVISDSIYPIALLHAQTPKIAAALKERGLLGEYEAPDEVEPEFISHDRSRRFLKYIKILLRGMGKRLEERDEDRIKDSFYHLDRQLVSRADLLSIIDAELDVFTQHAMLKRIPDAGGVEVGGIVRDLALYSAPVFSSLWGSPEKMPEKVIDTYLNIKRQFEESLRYPQKDFGKEELALGLLFASVTGNVRKAAAVVHYDGRDEGYPVAQQANLYLMQAYLYLNAFMNATGMKYNEEAGLIRYVLDAYGLRSDAYLLAEKQENPARGGLSRREFIKHFKPVHNAKRRDSKRKKESA